MYEWGIGYSKGVTRPEMILMGKDIKKVQASADRIFALSKDGTVYSLPRTKKDQEEGPKLDEPGWIPYSKSKASISYKTMKVPLDYFDKYLISDVQTDASICANWS